jgi:hypothetical protein
LAVVVRASAVWSEVSRPEAFSAREFISATRLASWFWKRLRQMSVRGSISSP